MSVPRFFVTVAAIAIDQAPSATSESSRQTTLCGLGLQVPAEGSAETTVAPPGRLSVIARSVASAGPALRTSTR